MLIVIIGVRPNDWGYTYSAFSVEAKRICINIVIKRFTVPSEESFCFNKCWCRLGTRLFPFEVWSPLGVWVWHLYFIRSLGSAEWAKSWRTGSRLRCAVSFPLDVLGFVSSSDLGGDQTQSSCQQLKGEEVRAMLLKNSCTDGRL